MVIALSLQLCFVSRPLEKSNVQLTKFTKTSNHDHVVHKRATLPPGVESLNTLCLFLTRPRCTTTPPQSSPPSSPTSRLPRSSSSVIPQPSTWTSIRPPRWPGGCEASPCCCLYTGVQQLQLRVRAWIWNIKIISFMGLCVSRQSPAVKTPDEYNAAYRLPEKVWH